MAGALPKEETIYHALYSIREKMKTWPLLKRKKNANLQPKIEWKQLKLKDTFK